MKRASTPIPCLPWVTVFFSKEGLTPVPLVARKEKLALSRETLACSQRATFGKQNRGQDGASMPDKERGSGLGDRSHGGEICEVEQARPR
jgi:hypothetical protein